MKMFKRNRYCCQCGKKLIKHNNHEYYCYHCPDCDFNFARAYTIGRRFAKILQMTGRR